MDTLPHVPLPDKIPTTSLCLSDRNLLDLGCPAGLLTEARQFATKASDRMIARYGADAPMSRVADALAECFDDPITVVMQGATDDPLSDLDPEVRDFAALVAGSREVA